MAQANEFGQQAWQVRTIEQVAGRTIREAQFDQDGQYVLAIDEDAAVFAESFCAHDVAAQIDEEPVVGWFLCDGDSDDADAVAIWLAQAGQDSAEFDSTAAACYDNGVFVPYKS